MSNGFLILYKNLHFPPQWSLFLQKSENRVPLRFYCFSFVCNSVEFVETNKIIITIINNNNVPFCMLWITNKNVNLLTLWRKIKFKKIIIIMDLSHVAVKLQSIIHVFILQSWNVQLYWTGIRHTIRNFKRAGKNDMCCTQIPFQKVSSTIVQ